MSEPAGNEGVPVASIEERAGRKGGSPWWETRWYPGLSQRVPGIDSKTLSVARHLAKRAGNKADGHCWPGLKDIRAATRLSRASVQRAIQTLELAGELYVDRGGPNEGASHYWLVPPELERSAREAMIEVARRCAEERRDLLQRQTLAAQKRRRQPAAKAGGGARYHRGPAIAAGQLRLPVAADASDQVVSHGRRVTPPPWCLGDHPNGVTQLPGGVRETPRSSKGSTQPPTPELEEGTGRKETPSDLLRTLRGESA